MISMDKKYRYRNGQDARILCTDRPLGLPVVSMTDRGALIEHTIEGLYTTHEAEWDLVEIRPKIHVQCWVNVYHNGRTEAYNTKQEANLADGSCAENPRIGCIHFEKEVEA